MHDGDDTATKGILCTWLRFKAWLRARVHRNARAVKTGRIGHYVLAVIARRLWRTVVAWRFWRTVIAWRLRLRDGCKWRIKELGRGGVAG